MGRYYAGDIEGKFWFGIQASDDADFFGGEHLEPQSINYYFGKEHLPEIEKGIKECLKALGQYKNRISDYFDGKKTYQDKKMAKELKVGIKKFNQLLGWYARWELGEKIKKCVEKKGSCEFVVF